MLLLPRPCEPAGAAKAGRSADKSGGEGAAAEAARKTPRKGRAAALGGSGPVAAGAAIRSRRGRGLASRFMLTLPLRLFPSCLLRTATDLF